MMHTPCGCYPEMEETYNILKNPEIEETRNETLESIEELQEYWADNLEELILGLKVS